jgi:hypothetical protein
MHVTAAYCSLLKRMQSICTAQKESLYNGDGDRQENININILSKTRVSVTHGILPTCRHLVRCLVSNKPKVKFMHISDEIRHNRQ